MAPSDATHNLPPVLAAVFNLNHHASYVHWHFFQMSVSNILMIAAMFVVFFVAILAPFPHGRKRD